jgi:hypothetical protein
MCIGAGDQKGINAALRHQGAQRCQPWWALIR